MKNTIHLVLADGQRLFRECLARVLTQESDIQVCGHASNVREVCEQVEAHRPDLVVLDTHLPLQDGDAPASAEQNLHLIQRLKSNYPHMRFVLLTSSPLSQTVAEYFAAGVQGYLVKDTSADGLIAALRAVWAGEQVLTPSLTGLLLRQLQPNSHPAQEPHTSLTGREQELLLLVARGMVAKEISRALTISEKTVRNHLSNMYKKLDLYDRSQLVLYAIRHGLIDPRQQPELPAYLQSV